MSSSSCSSQAARSMPRLCDGGGTGPRVVRTSESGSRVSKVVLVTNETRRWRDDRGRAAGLLTSVRNRATLAGRTGNVYFLSRSDGPANRSCPEESVIVPDLAATLPGSSVVAQPRRSPAISVIAVSRVVRAAGIAASRPGFMTVRPALLKVAAWRRSAFAAVRPQSAAGHWQIKTSGVPDTVAGNLAPT